MNSRALTARKFILFIAVVCLLAMWVAVVVVDFLNLGELQHQVIAITNSGLPLLWYWLFREGQLVEMVQWLLLGCSAVAMFFTFRQLRSVADQTTQIAMIILCFGLTLMLVEDSMNFRHVMASIVFIPWLTDVSNLTSTEVRMIWELTFYLVLAICMAVPVWLFWKARILSAGTIVWLVPAYGVYGLVGFGSALRRLGSWQERLGEHIIHRFSLLELPAWSQSNELLFNHPIWTPPSANYLGYLLVDHLFEESIELIAAILLFVAMTRLAGDLLGRCDAIQPIRR
ncbi:MAG: hypothetical protein LAT62_05415 [Natronospirillum sp.]|uniref:hypothetical protein n=1 Tax=Natronospirillum sp. TaxID=2812955 RepID=UPI0025DA9530|nr:hypothetical protein [Natronospirillum sp.]MCH8551354.1 hypothetical protein [Natronospirillum sp.]